MPRFYFHLCTDVIASDNEGLDLPNSATARQHAIKAVRLMACEAVMDGRFDLGHGIVVTDDRGVEVLTVKTPDAVTITD